MKRLFAILLLVAALLATGCVQPRETPQFQPTYTPVPLDRVLQDPAYGAVAENVVSVVEGVVIGKEGERTIGRYRYSDWSVEVVRYLVDPLPFERVTVCIAERETGPEGEWLPARVAYYPLSPREHVILFLGKQYGLKEAEFVLPGPPHFEWRKASIEEGKVQFWGAFGARHSGEPLGEFVARLQRYAQEAGRTVPSAHLTFGQEEAPEGFRPTSSTSWQFTTSPQ